MFKGDMNKKRAKALQKVKKPSRFTVGKLSSAQE